MTAGAKRILMLTHEFPPMRGGISRYAVELATAASQLGHSVTVLAPDSGHDCGDLDNQLPFTIKRYHASAYGPKELPALLWRTAAVDKSRFDLIHAVDPSFVMSLAFVQKFKRLDYQATVYGTDILGLRTSLQATATGTRRMFEYPNRLVAISQFTRDLLISKCPRIPENRVEVTPLGVHPFWFERATPIDLDRKFSIPADHRLLLTVSRLDSRKGHRGLLQGIAQLSAPLKQKLSYAIVGSGTDTDYRQQLEELARRSGCTVRFLGNLSDDDIRSLYSRATLFCMTGEPDPQKIEGFGLVYLEAAAQALPSLASDLGAVPEVVAHGQSGWLVPPAQPESIAAALTSLLGDKNLIRSLGQTAKAKAMQYTWERCARLTYGEAA